MSVGWHQYYSENLGRCLACERFRVVHHGPFPSPTIWQQRVSIPFTEGYGPRCSTRHRYDAAPLLPQRPRASGRRCALVYQHQSTSSTLYTRSSFGQVRNGAWVVSRTAKNFPVRHQWGDDKQHNINTFISSNLPQSQRGGCAFFLGSVDIWERLSAFQLPCHV